MGTDMDGHLDARLRAGALENNIEPVLLAELVENEVCTLLGSLQRLLGRLGPCAGGEAEHVLGETLRLREGQSRLVDVDGDHSRCTVRF